jgi:RNA polymerase sigma-70 factor (ECF subfamily)
MDLMHQKAYGFTMHEADLIDRLRAGSDEAFDQLVKTHGGRMLRVARRFLKNEEDARDAVQDAFISAFRSIGGFHAESRLSTWLHRITVNAALMRLRSYSRLAGEESIEPLLPKFRADGHQIESSVPWRGADDELQEAELQDLVRNAIDQLPENYRVVLLLRDIEEMTPEETAEALGITKTAVKVRLHRARQALRTLLDPEMRKP